MEYNFRVPDKAALIHFLFVSQFCVLADSSARISHRVRIFAANKRLVTMLGEKFFNRENKG